MVNLSGEKKMYTFSTLAKKVKTVRNQDSHVVRKETVFENIDENMKAILELLDELRLWYENNQMMKEFQITNNAIKLVNDKFKHFKTEVRYWITA